MKHLSTLATFLLPLLASAVDEPVPIPMAGIAATHIPSWNSPYRRPSFDEHLNPPPPPPPVEKILNKRQGTGGVGSADFVVHMCRDTAQTSCDAVWVSAAQYCYDNYHWFGWTGGTFQSAKIEGTMCCSFWIDPTCNKAGGYVGWNAQICQEDTGSALIVPGGITSWMCNVPYGSANVHMMSSPPDVSTIPAGAGAAQATISPTGGQ